MDVYYPAGYAVNLLYVGVILLGLRAPDPRLAIEVAVASTGLSLLGRALSPASGNEAMGYFNLSLSLLLIWATAIGLVRYRRSAVEQSAARIRAQGYLDVVSVAVRVLDPAGRIVLMNRRGLELLGRSEAEVVGHGWEEFIRPEDRSAWREALQGLSLHGLPHLDVAHESSRDTRRPQSGGSVDQRRAVRRRGQVHQHPVVGGGHHRTARGRRGAATIGQGSAGPEVRARSVGDRGHDQHPRRHHVCQRQIHRNFKVQSRRTARRRTIGS